MRRSRWLFTALIVVGSLVFSQVPVAPGNVIVVRRAGGGDPCASYTPPSFDIEEDFEGAVSASMCDSGTSTFSGTTGQSQTTTNCDYTTDPLYGSESLYMNNDYPGGYFYVSVSGGCGDDAAVAFVWKPNTWDATSNGVLFAIDSGIYCSLEVDGSGNLTVEAKNGSPVDTGADVSQGTTYWIQLYHSYLGATCDAYIVTTNPATGGWGSYTRSTGSGTWNPGEFKVRGVDTDNVFLLDEIHFLCGDLIEGCEFE